MRRLIEDAWKKEEVLVLDFSGVRIASVSFFDEALGLLARDYSLDELRRHVSVENISEADRALLNRIVVSRSKEGSEKEAG